MNSQSTISVQSTGRPRRQRNEQPGGFDSELQWWLNESQSIMGEKAATVTPSESGRNSGTKGVFRPYHEPFSDRALGFGPLYRGIGLIERATRCRSAWARLEPTHRDVLMARYLFVGDQSQKGLHGAAGEVAGVVILLASKRERPDKALEEVAKTQGWEAYQKALRKKAGLIAKAIEACRLAHLAWRDCRVEVDQAEVSR